MRIHVVCFLFLGLFSACSFDRSALGAPAFPSDAGSPASDAASPPEPVWPRSHPEGTLLVDHEHALWMVGEHGFRLPISSSDDIGAVGLLPRDATAMTSEEERCLTPAADRWNPPNADWWPVYGPDEQDPGPYAVDQAALVRYPISLEAVKSYGYYIDLLDFYDDPVVEWSSLAVGDPIGLREGTLVHTEYGFSYVAHGRSFYLSPLDLVADAGFHPENSLSMSDLRLRELAPPAFEMTRDSFDFCPADEVSP